MLTTTEPESEKPNPLIPIDEPPLKMEVFEGMNTQATRVGVADQQCAWIDGFFPVAPRNLRTMYGIGTVLYTATGGNTVVWYDFYNIGAVAYAAVFLSDGSAIQVQVSNGAATTVLPAGTIINPAITNVGLTQYGRQYLIIVANQPNGYWLWDGTLLYQAGTLGPLVTLTNPGSGYKTAPVVVASGGSGSGATFVASIAGGFVTNVVVTNPGSGYLPGQTITLAFSGGNSGGSGGALTAVLSSAGGGSGATFTVNFQNFAPSSWRVLSVVVTNGGSGYSSFTTLNLAVTTSPPGGAVNPSPAATLQPVISGGVITAVTIFNPGGYVVQTGHTPVGTLTAIDAGAFTVTSVTVNNPGSGYSASATAVCSGGGAPVAQATLQLVLNPSTGAITSVTVASGGIYGSNTPPTVTVSDPVVNAAATATLMPFGVQGTDIETYQASVWVINGPTLFFTAPSSVSDFATSDGGGNRVSNDSFLRVGYVRIINTNGFLFLIADSSINYISGVQTAAGSPPTTTFTNQNADPEVGTPYPASVIKVGQNIQLANSFGIHEMNGAKAVKISDDLDGVYGSVANFGGQQLSAAQATIFNKKCQLTLVQIVDPISGSTANKIFMRYGKKWFATMQDVALTFIASQEINSVFTAYGTDGTHIYPLFQQPSTAFSKVVQSKLWDTPVGIETTKTTGRLWGMARYYSTLSPALTFNIDNEDSDGATYIPGNVYTITPAGLGTKIFGPQAVGQKGALTGMTMTTQAADMSLIQSLISSLIHDFRG
jgi:hypothetical protein